MGGAGLDAAILFLGRGFKSRARTTAILAAMAAAALTAQANTSTFTLDQDGCSGTCGLSPFGTVVITDMGSGADAYVLVTETLTAGDEYVRTGAGDALEFQLSKAATSITDLTAGFSTTSGSQTASTFGSFSNGIFCSGCGNGASNPLAGPLSFRLYGVTTADFIANADGNYFASDILGSNGKTGNVGSAGTPINQSSVTATPEPRTIVLFLSALAVICVRRLPILQSCSDKSGLVDRR